MDREVISGRPAVVDEATSPVCRLPKVTDSWPRPLRSSSVETYEQSVSNSSEQHDDVRMRGFRSRSTVEQALAWVDAHSPVRPSVAVPLEHAAGRVLA